MHIPQISTVLSCSDEWGKSGLEKCPSGACTLSSPSTDSCFHKCQECSLFPSAGAAQCWRLESNYWHSVAAAAAARTGSCNGSFWASGICKENYGMGLPLGPGKRHHRGSPVLYSRQPVCCCNTPYLLLKKSSSISFSLPLSSLTGSFVWSVYHDLRKDKEDVHP